MTSHLEGDWTGPGVKRKRPPFTWRALLWSMVYPQRGHRILPTVPGVALIALCFGIGLAAYNSSSNILFITLSLLLACLILSGVLSWLNLRGVRWRLRLAPPLRAGHDTVVVLELRNAKRVLPTYGLWFEFAAKPAADARKQRAETTINASGKEVRAALAKAEAEIKRGQVPLPARLDPQGETRVEWLLKPEKRGRLRVELTSVGSLFPFGFLKKDVGTELELEAVIWPAPIEYRRHAISTARRTAGGDRVTRAGASGDLFAVRKYAQGDSHRLIHWKASARTGTLLVRQFAAESAEGYALWLRTDAGVWARPDQFEVLVSFVATMAEDLFRAGRLLSVAIDAEPPVAARRVHDLEHFLDKLAVLEPKEDVVNHAGTDPTLVAKRNVITFSPDGVRGVAAHVDGQVAATA